ncbi:MAG: tetratricopeptide repeat protein [Pseudonocardiales bacterium]
MPTGTVTMLFSDIEGSTALLSRLGDRYGAALSAQRRIMRAAIGKHHGHEMGTEGDSFFVVFESAHDALATCVQAQQALQSQEWPGGDPVWVRMGLHTGEPTRHEEGYIGLDLNRAARIAATAHGGQIVISAATGQLIATALPPDHSLIDLGSHRLKDIDELQRIFQVAAPGLPAQFPPLKSLGARSNLPTAPTALLGRETELRQLRDLVLQPGVRLVTLTGPGGVGKTRLAVALAEAMDQTFPAGVFFVPLATVSSGEVMWKTLADSLDAATEQEPATAVKAYLSDRRALLVLDNLEQLHEAASVISDLLAAARKLVVIATSRRPVRVQGEAEYAVSPLTVPDPGDAEAVAASPAVNLFVRQAGLVRRGFTLTPDNAADVAAICRRLDGLPLAIELAASRAKLLAPKALLARLSDSLALTATDVGRPSRQRTLRATIAWSYDLLSPELEQVFARMGVFVGGADLDAVAAVACPPEADPLDAVTELLDASLIRVDETSDGEPRVAMLATIHEYAADRLVSSGLLAETRRRHAECYCDLAERAEAQLRGPYQLAWLDRLELEYDNLHAALSWALDGNAMEGDDRRPQIGLRLVNALSWFWYGHSHVADGRRWLELALEQAAADEGPDLARAVHGLGVLLLQQGEAERARATLDQNLALWRRLDDKAGLAKGLSSLAVAHRVLDQNDLARQELTESIQLSRDAGNDAQLSTALSNLAVVEADSGQPQQAVPVLEESIALDRRLGDAWGVAVGQSNLAGLHLRVGQTEQAHRLLQSIVDDVLALGDEDLLAGTLELFAIALAEFQSYERAACLFGAAEALRETASVPLAPPDLVVLERSVGQARSRLGEEAWERERAAGRLLTSAQAVDVARRHWRAAPQ